MNDRGGRDLRRIQFSRVSWKEDLQGKTLHDWAVEERMEPTVENGAELVIRAQLNGGCGAIYHAMDDADVNRIMQHPQTMIGSDGGLAEIGKLHPHPRYYGTFPRVIGHYARDLALFPVETAIYKMTGLSADRLGIKDRGRIKEGNFADLVIFDVATIIDKSTFTEPHQYPEGIPFVIINGKIAVDNGEFYPVKSGKVLRGPGYLKEN
jgi:N-acyl-D-aspartate/D-glutamate deacylase